MTLKAFFHGGNRGSKPLVSASFFKQARNTFQLSINRPSLKTPYRLRSGDLHRADGSVVVDVGGFLELLAEDLALHEVALGADIEFVLEQLF